jgi:hypothetical protein
MKKFASNLNLIKFKSEQFMDKNSPIDEMPARFVEVPNVET